MQPSSHAELSDHGHAKFVELCALYSTGSLSRDEMLELTGHLAECDECRNLLTDYQALVHDGIPLLADDSVVELKAGFDRELAKTKKLVLAQLTHTETGTAETVRREWFRLPGLHLGSSCRERSSGPTGSVCWSWRVHDRRQKITPPYTHADCVRPERDAAFSTR